MFAKIVVGPSTLSLVISDEGLCSLLGIPPLEPESAAGTTIELPFTIRRRRVENKLVIAGEQREPLIDQKLIKAVSNAHDWMERVIAGI